MNLREMHVVLRLPIIVNSYLDGWEYEVRSFVGNEQ
jgi:hypothetical protein